MPGHIMLNSVAINNHNVDSQFDPKTLRMTALLLCCTSSSRGSEVCFLFSCLCGFVMRCSFSKARKSSQAPGAAATRNKSEARIKGGGAVMSTDYVGGRATHLDGGRLFFFLSLSLPVRFTLLCFRKVRPIEKKNK